MKHLNIAKLTIIVLVIFLSTTACGLLQVIPGATTPTPPPTQASDATAAPEPEDGNPTPTSTFTETAPEPEIGSSYTGFVVYQRDLKEFQLYDLDGNVTARYPAPGIENLAFQQIDIVGSNIYYYSQMDGQLYLTNQSGLIALTNQPAVKPYAFRISADEKQIAWSTANFEVEPVSSELWIGNLDGSDARKIAMYDSSMSPAFLFIPLEWTADGKLLYNRSQTGFGGYILYGGHNSLYSYDPASMQLVTYVPAEELHGLCLDSYRLDLDKVVFNCGPDGSQIRVRSLADSSEQGIPNPPDFLLAGSARFSPGGEWLAYAAARGNPDQEGGKLLLVPGDLSADPVEIIHEEGGYYQVHAWLDEDTLLVSHNQISGSNIRQIDIDGSNEQKLVQGWFVGMMP